MRWMLPLVALIGCDFIEVVDKDIASDTASTYGGATYAYVLVGDRSSTDLSSTAGIDLEGIRLDTPSGGIFYSTLVHECEFGPGREDEADCSGLVGSPGSESVSLGGDGGTVIVSFGGEYIESGATITVYEDGYESGELYDIYVGDTTSSNTGTWTTCAAGATGEFPCEVP